MSFNYLIFRPSQNKLSNGLTTDNEIIGFAKLVKIDATRGLFIVQEILAFVRELY